jgi:murein DD-endopeptidase MepM/ murein hydrolase activator NlpD
LLVDTFTQARAGGQRVHDAIDIMAPAGAAVVAAGPGTVEKLFLSKDGGNAIYLRSPDRRTIHYYAHLQDYAAGLHEGQVVRQGEALGRVGSTGNANPAAPHLHFAIMATRPEAHWYDPSTAVNPYPLLVNHTHATNGVTG